jgi:hypothetical protein
MTSTDDRNHSDFFLVKSGNTTIQQERELSDQNLMNGQKRELFACSRMWIRLGESGRVVICNTHSCRADSPKKLRFSLFSRKSAL